MTVNYDFCNEVIRYVGSDYKSYWYVGIATNPEERLFHNHRVNKQYGRWVYSSYMSENDARETEKYLLDNYPFQGDVGGGEHPCYVYAYKVTSETNE